MRDLIRETVLGHTIRLLGGKAGHRLLPYPEEEPNFSVPADWPPPPPSGEPDTTADGREDVNAEVNSTVQGGRVQDEEAQEIRVANEVKKTQPDGGIKIVTWYSDTDPSNPQNWSDTKKAVVMFPICLLTFGVSSS
jgi:DHA1 family multidrug resistance protein-like MFS transporter